MTKKKRGKKPSSAFFQNTELATLHVIDSIRNVSTSWPEAERAVVRDDGDAEHGMKLYDTFIISQIRFRRVILEG